MKLYKEAMRRLGLVGIALLAVSVVLTAIFCASSANGIAQGGMQVNSVFDLLPTLSVFAYAGGIGFAYVGFSFLNKRADSDFYHSLPVRRSDLYIANTLAALTWTVATVVLSAIVSLVVYLFVAAPFVPAYYPLGVLFFIVATMLVYAAAAIAVSVTGTLFTNIVMTGIVLFLPRFILFMIGRTVVAGVNIVGWWDLQGLLNPRTNVATGLIVMTRRAFLGKDFVTLGNSLYSLLLAAVEIVLGGWLFVKRPSELAERGAKNSRLQTLFACLLTLPVLLVMLRYTNTVRKLTIAILVVASLAIYIAYQAIALRGVKRVAKTLPWYVCTAALAFAVFFGMRAVNTSVLNVSPAASEIQSVQFGVPEPEWGEANYNNLLVSNIVFTEDEVKDCVAKYLHNAVERLQTAADTEDYYYGSRTFEKGVSNSIIPVKITLHNGRVIKRSFEFTNMNVLNTARETNAEYCKAIRSFPNVQEACFVRAESNNDSMTKANALKLKETFFSEMTAENQIAANEFLIVDPAKALQSGNWYSKDGEQSFGTLFVGGYAGTQRFYQYYNIQLQTPNTAALWMQLNNQIGGADVVRQAEAEVQELRERAEENSSGNISLIVTNVPMQDGSKQQIYFNSGWYYYDGKEQGNDIGAKYIDEMLEILRRGTLTSDPNALSVCVDYYIYYSTNSSKMDTRRLDAAVYLTLTPEDAASFIRVMRDWNEAQAERQRVYDPDYSLPEIAAGAVG